MKPLPPSPLLHDPSRREFLRRSAPFAGLGAAAPLALQLAAAGQASAAEASGYKALVCVFLFGGNDAYNTVLATDSDSWAAYRKVRNQAPDSLALSKARVLAFTPRRDQGRTYALHPAMGATRSLFEAGRVAVVANVGPLLRPTTKADWANSKRAKPANLFSHNDQQATWQSLSTEGAQVGWGGRFADRLASSNQHAIFSAISASGNALWLAGKQVLQYQVSTQGALDLASGSWLFGSPQVASTLRSVMRNARTQDLLARDYASVVRRSTGAEAMVTASLPPAGTPPYASTGDDADPLLYYTSPNGAGSQRNPLAQQLQIVARLIGARASLGARRQVFFVSLGGFDTHDRQMSDHAELLAKLSHGLKYFDGVMNALGLEDQVTTFTASEFGRSFTSNGDGSDHGWGSHHLVMGGAVKGGDLYGRFPEYGLPQGLDDFSSPHQIANGALLPQLSVDQYGATLGRWFGLSDSALLEVFPNLGAFSASRRDLGFMRA